VEQQGGTKKKPDNSGQPEFNGNVLILKNTASKIIQIFQPVRHGMLKRP